MSSPFSIVLLFYCYKHYIYLKEVTFNGLIGCSKIGINRNISGGKDKSGIDPDNIVSIVGEPGFVIIYYVVLGSNYWLVIFGRLSFIVEFFLQTFHFV